MTFIVSRHFHIRLYQLPPLEFVRSDFVAFDLVRQQLHRRDCAGKSAYLIVRLNGDRAA
jgi:hypothetical protein